MATKITKLNNCSASNYTSRGGRSILNIVIGMTNNVHSGSAYANMYKSPLSPNVSYHYVIDKKGNIFQPIDETNAAFCVNASSSTTQTDNQEAISICFMPEWSGGGMYDDYDYGQTFPKDPEAEQVFLLTKGRTIGGVSYPTGIYHYNGAEWILDEEVDPSEIKRPYKSPNWSITSETEDALLGLVKWLQVTKSINNARVFRVYDFYRTYNPAPYIDDEDNTGLWDEFKNKLQDTEFQVHTIVGEKTTPINPEYVEPGKSTTEIIEQYGPEAGLYTYKCIRTDKCPYYNQLMNGKECSLKGFDDIKAQDIQKCPYRQKVAADKSFKGNALVDVSSMPGNKFSFELGIHDILKTEAKIENGVAKTVTSGNLWHITSAGRNIKWTTHIENNCDEMTFEYYNAKNEIPIKEGFNVGYWINGFAGFNGNVFALSQKGKDRELIDVTCYGYLKYLQQEGWRCFENKTASQIFDEVCTLANVPHRIVTPSSYVIKASNCFATTYYAMIQKALHETMVHEKKWYIIQPNFGELIFRDILDSENRWFDTPIGKVYYGSNIKQIKFSEDSAIIDWDFDSNINESANIIVTYTEGEKDETTGEVQGMWTGDAKDESSIQEWGRLSKVIKDDDKKGKMKISAADWLKFYNSPRRTLKLSCLGVPGVIAGNIIYVEIYNVVSVGTIKGCLVVDECTHNVSGDKHTMELTCEIVQDGTIRANVYKALKTKQESEKLDNEKT